MPEILAKSGRRRFVTVILRDRVAHAPANPLAKRLGKLQLDHVRAAISPENTSRSRSMQANHAQIGPELGFGTPNSDDFGLDPANFDAETGEDDDTHTETGPIDAVSTALATLAGGDVHEVDVLEPEADASGESEVDLQAIRESWERLSLSTRESYARELERLAKLHAWDETSPLKALATLASMGKVKASNAIRRYRDHGTVSSATRARRVHAVSAMLRALHRAGAIAWEPSARAPVIVPEQDRSGPPVEDVNKLIDTTRQAVDDEAKRDLALILLLFDQALRRSEACGLRLRDLDLQHGRVHVARKGDHGRRSWIPISQRTLTALRAFLTGRPTDPDDPLFPSPQVAYDDGAAVGKHPMPLSGRSVGRILERRARAAGIKGEVRPHGLRHTALTTAASHFDAVTLARFAGHTDPKTTMRYIDDIGTATRGVAEHVASAGRAAEPEDAPAAPKAKRASSPRKPKREEDEDFDLGDLTVDSADDSPF